MATPTSMKRLKRFEQAAKDKAWIGAAHPGDHRAIIEEYEDAKAKLIESLK